MYLLHVEADFSSAHQLREYRGRCENLHGHNWRVLLTVAGRRLDPLGMLIDFGVLKRHLREACGALDHLFLNQHPPFDRINPTSENLARHLAETVGPQLPPGVRVRSVRVWESERASATYLPDEDAAEEDAHG